MKRALLIGLMVALAALASYGVVVASNPQTTYDIRLIVAHDPAPPYYMQAMKHFADRVENETGGHVRIQVLTGRQYGTIETAMLRDSLVAGRFEMSAVTVGSLGYIDRDFWVFEMPYLFDNYAQVARTIDGSIGQRLMDKLSNYGLRGLAYTYSGGFKVVCSRTKPLTSPSDFAQIDMLTHDPVNIAIFKALGSRIHDGIYRESKALMAQRKIEASEMTLTRYKEYGLKAKYVNQLDHSFFLTALVINERFYQKLPEAYRQAIATAAREVALEERARTVQENEAICKEIAAKGVHVVSLTPAQREQFREATRSVYTSTRDLFTPGLVAQIRASFVAMRH